MAKYVFNGAYPRYYPTIPLFAKYGEVHDITAAPDADWSPVDGPETATVAPVAAPVAESTPPAVPVAQAASDDLLHTAEALLEANPELARKLVEDVKNA